MTNLGKIQQTSAAISIEVPVPHDFLEPSTKNTNKTLICLPAVNLSHFPEDRKQNVKQILI